MLPIRFAHNEITAFNHDIPAAKNGPQLAIAYYALTYHDLWSVWLLKVCTVSSFILLGFRKLDFCVISFLFTMLGTLPKVRTDSTERHPIKDI